MLRTLQPEKPQEIAHNIGIRLSEEPGITKAAIIAGEVLAVSWRPKAARYASDAMKNLARFLASRGRARWSQATTADVTAWVTAPVKGRPAAQGTVYIRRSMARQLARIAKERWGVSNEAAGTAELRGKPQTIIWSREDVEKLLTPEVNPRPAVMAMQVALELCYGSGLRIGEVCAIKVEDVDLEQGTGRVVGKGGKERLFFMTRPAMETVTKWLTAYRPSLAKGPGGTLLLTERGGPPIERGLGLTLALRQKERQIACGFHDLRRAFATHLLEAGASMGDIKTLLGHAHLSTTQLYVKPSQAFVMATYQKCHPRSGKGGGL